MLWVNVDIRVKPGMADRFLQESRLNVEQSRQEPGVLAFELLVDQDDAHHFTLVELYRGSDAAAAHKQTLHYARWREEVEPMMQAARTSSKWNPVFSAFGE